MQDNTVKLLDGRNIDFAEYERPDGVPLFIFHRTPGFGVFRRPGMRSSWLLPLGLLLLLYAGISALNSRTGEGGDYHALGTLSGVVTGVYMITDRVENRRVGAWLDTMPNTEKVQMYGPGVPEADRRIHAIPAGTRVTVHYDGYTQKVWALERADGGPGFSESDVRPWLDKAHASERRTMHWLLGAALLAIVAGIGSLIRDSS